MSTLAFLPWLRLEHRIDAAEFNLIPYERGSTPVGPHSGLQKTLDAVTEPYLTRPGKPIHYATLLQIAEEPNLIRDLSDEERGAFFILAEIVAVCGLSYREYFQPWGYWNRDNFRLVVQSFSDPYAGVMVTTRRRDGCQTNFLSKKRYQVIKAEHIPLHGPIQLDMPLLEALLQARNSTTWNRLFESMVCFNLANTDSSGAAEEMEAVLLLAAIQRLLDCERQKEAKLAEKFTKTLTPKNDLARSACNRPLNIDLIKQCKKSATVREIWIRDFYRLRGNLAHGCFTPQYAASWSLRDHLLLASFAFPLLLKSTLGKMKMYVINEKDRFWIDLFEALACEQHFSLVDKSEQEEYPWNRVISRARGEQLRKLIADGAQERGVNHLL